MLLIFLFLASNFSEIIKDFILSDLCPTLIQALELGFSVSSTDKLPALKCISDMLQDLQNMQEVGKAFFSEIKKVNFNSMCMSSKDVSDLVGRIEIFLSDLGSAMRRCNGAKLQLSEVAELYNSGLTDLFPLSRLFNFVEVIIFGIVFICIF